MSLKCKFLILPIFFLVISGCERPTSYNQADSGIPPAVPANPVVYAAYDGIIIIYWQSNSEPDLKGYNIYRSTDSVNFKPIGFSSDNSFEDDSLNYTTRYFYRVTAEDIWNNESMPSKIISAEPLNIYTPYTPAGLSINARNWEGKKSIYLRWNANNESDIAGYKIYRSTTPDFIPDTSTYIGFSSGINYTDSLNLELYTTYYYSIKAVDLGGLISKASNQASDEILGIPQILFPLNGASTPYFSQFLIKSISKPAEYKIIVQDNQYFGEIWSKDFSTSNVNDTLAVTFDANYIYPNTYYYWRVATFTDGGTNPNSISELYKFIIKQ